MNQFETNEALSKNDSTKKKQSKTDDKIRIVQFTQNDTSKKNIDTSIQFLHRNPLINEWQIDLGNFASSSKSILFLPNLLAQRNSGFQLANPLARNNSTLKYYNTTRPYTNLYYRIGTKQEQMIEILQSQNINPNWNITASYSKIGSPGMYQLQKTNHDIFQLSTNYNSKNKRYSILGGFTYNKLQQDENGGILYDSLLYNNDYNDKRLVPVKFVANGKNNSAVENYFRSALLDVEQSYFIGKTSITLSKDSEIIKTFKPIFGLRHKLYSNFEYQRYKDLAPEQANYSKLLISNFQDNDSVIARYYTTQIGNQFSLHGNVNVKNKTLQAEAGYGIEIESPQTKSFNQFYVNNFIVAQIKKESLGEKEWLYNAHAKFYFAGNAIGNLEFSAIAGRAFAERIGNLTFNFNQVIQQAPYSYIFYKSNYYQQTKSFTKQSITKIGGEYNNTFYKIKAGLQNYLITNYIYRDSNWNASQYTQAIPLLQVYFNKQFQLKNWVMDQHYLYQQVSDKTPIHLPLLSIRYRLAYERFIFNEKLKISTGLDARYNSAYQADNYNPIFNTFTPQYQAKISNVPQLGAFFNFKVKRFRAFVSIDEIQQNITANNLNFTHYPAQNLIFRFGFHWAFIN